MPPIFATTMVDRYRLSWLIVFSTVFIFACKNEKATRLTAAQQQAKLDSTIKMMQEEIRISEEENLRDRKSIELKIRVDSILKAKEKIAPKPKEIPPIYDSTLLSDSITQ